MEKVRKRWFIPLGLMIGTAILGLIFNQPPIEPVASGPVQSGDVAWMLTASGLVLLMTPGLAFFYGGMGLIVEMWYLQCCKALLL